MGAAKSRPARAQSAPKAPPPAARPEAERVHRAHKLRERQQATHEGAKAHGMSWERQQQAAAGAQRLLEKRVQRNGQPKEPKWSPMQHVSQCKFDKTCAEADGCACEICMDDFDAGQQIATLPCFHRFHTNCIQGWYSTGATTCPTCRHGIER